MLKHHLINKDQNIFFDVYVKKLNLNEMTNVFERNMVDGTRFHYLNLLQLNFIGGVGSSHFNFVVEDI